MKIEKPAVEPSMDEILASIRHIISGDSREEKEPFSISRNRDDILDLTDALPEEGQKTESVQEEKKENPKCAIPNLQKEGTGHLLKEFSETKQEEASRDFPTPDYGFEEPLVSTAAISEAAQALHSLNKLASESPKYADSRFSEGFGGQTVENLVRETLKPLLKEWLDTNLPTLVRWVVNEQVERIVRQVGATHSPSASEKEKSYSKL